MCQHNERHKLPKEISIRNTECTGFIDIIIKKISKDTRYRDEFLRMTVTMPAIIKIKLEHNYPLRTANSMKLLRVSDEVICINTYFFHCSMHT